MRTLIHVHAITYTCTLTYQLGTNRATLIWTGLNLLLGRTVKERTVYNLKRNHGMGHCIRTVEIYMTGADFRG